MVGNWSGQRNNSREGLAFGTAHSERGQEKEQRRASEGEIERAREPDSQTLG